MDKFCVFVYMLMREASLKQRIPCIIPISILDLFQHKKSAHYTRVNTVSHEKYGHELSYSVQTEDWIITEKE